MASPFFVQILVRELQLAFLLFFLFANACSCARPRGGIWDLFGDGHRPREAKMEAVSKHNNARNANFMIFLKFVTFLCFSEISESHFGRILVARGSQNEAKIMKKTCRIFQPIPHGIFMGFGWILGARMRENV